MKPGQLLIFLWLTTGACLAAFDYPATSAGNASLANSTLAAGGLPEASWLNPALGLAVNHWYATLSYSRLFNLSELTYASGFAGWRKGGQAYGLGLSSFGGSNYRETQVRLLAARALLADRLWLGMALNGFFIRATGYSLNPAWGLDIGFRYRLHPQWSLASTLENFNAPKINGYGEEVPQRLRLGVAYRPVPAAVVHLAVEKDRFYDPLVLLGVSYRLSAWLELASGFTSNSDFPSAGLFLNTGSVNIQYGIQSHFDLGVTHFFQISFSH
ncbi:MAG: hypothetical protein D6715_12685 [Calditrichaeota bacterium]|nr:MAG: hypothetical protein D6715_12685 [Calditrichota bacterium]